MPENRIRLEFKNNNISVFEKFKNSKITKNGQTVSCTHSSHMQVDKILSSNWSKFPQMSVYEKYTQNIQLFKMPIAQKLSGLDIIFWIER